MTESEKKGLTFGRAVLLLDSCGHDPTNVMVGEISDPARTAQIAVKAAVTGPHEWCVATTVFFFFFFLNAVNNQETVDLVRWTRETRV